MKFKKDSDQWPKDSLKRSLLLNYPGCKSTLDALELIKSQKNITASQTPNEYEAMRSAILELEKAFSSVDFNSLDPETILLAQSLPLKNIQDIQRWRDTWLDVLGSRGKHGEDFP